jgi:hypothetical protein
MNWKHVAYLIRVDRKSGRLIRGQRLSHYRESMVLTYLLYGGAIAIGLAVGFLVGMFYNSALAAPNATVSTKTVQGVFLSLPTIVLIYVLVFTMLQQIQRSGIKFSSEVPYWLPITWQ